MIEKLYVIEMDDSIFLLLIALAIVAFFILFVRQLPNHRSVSWEVYHNLQAQNESLQKALEDKERELREATAKLAAQERTLLHQQEQAAGAGNQVRTDDQPHTPRV